MTVPQCSMSVGWCVFVGKSAGLSSLIGFRPHFQQATPPPPPQETAAPYPNCIPFWCHVPLSLELAYSSAVGKIDNCLLSEKLAASITRDKACVVFCFACRCANIPSFTASLPDLTILSCVLYSVPFSTNADVHKTQKPLGKFLPVTSLSSSFPLMSLVLLSWHRLFCYRKLSYFSEEVLASIFFSLVHFHILYTLYHSSPVQMFTKRRKPQVSPPGDKLELEFVFIVCCSSVSSATLCYQKLNYFSEEGLASHYFRLLISTFRSFQ